MILTTASCTMRRWVLAACSLDPASALSAAQREAIWKGLVDRDRVWDPDPQALPEVFAAAQAWCDAQQVRRRQCGEED